MTTVTVKRGDVGVVFTDTLTIDDDPADLTGATIHFLMRKGTTLITGVAVVDGNEVTYTTVADDLAVAGSYLQEWEARWAAGRVLTFPSEGQNIVKVSGDLGDVT